MLNLSQELHKFRKWIVTKYEYGLEPGTIMHVMERGPTRPENFGPTGFGPWARIYIASPWRLQSDPNAEMPLIPTDEYVDYVIVLYVPRVFTTESLLKTLLHEYLHVGRVRGTLRGMPHISEWEIDQHACYLERLVRSSAEFERFAWLFDTPWADLKREGIGGFCLQNAPVGDTSVLLSFQHFQELN